MNIWKKIMIFTSMAMLLVACGKGDTKREQSADTKGEDTKKLTVYASVYPVYDFAQKIGGDKIHLELMVPNGQEPHDWEPGQDDIKNLEKADMFIYNGAGLESWTDKVLSSLTNKKLVAVEASKGIELLHGHHDHEEAQDEHHEDKAADSKSENGKKDEGKKSENGKSAEHDHEAAQTHEHEHDHGEFDPHVWLSPKNAKIELKNIKDALVAADGANKDFYEANYEKYSKEFDDLDKKFQSELAKVPNKTIVVSHEAFGYLCKEYGLNQVGIEGVNAESEPDAKTMANIVELVKNKKINTIFTEELIDPKVADTIAKETGAKTKVLSPLEGLSEEQQKDHKEYVSIMEQNLQNLIEALK